MNHDGLDPEVNEDVDSQTVTRGHDDWIYPDDLLAGAWYSDPYGPDEYEAELEP